MYTVLHYLAIEKKKTRKFFLTITFREKKSYYSIKDQGQTLKVRGESRENWSIVWIILRCTCNPSWKPSRTKNVRESGRQTGDPHRSKAVREWDRYNPVVGDNEFLPNDRDTGSRRNLFRFGSRFVRQIRRNELRVRAQCLYFIASPINGA